MISAPEKLSALDAAWSGVHWVRSCSSLVFVRRRFRLARFRIGEWRMSGCRAAMSDYEIEITCSDGTQHVTRVAHAKVQIKSDCNGVIMHLAGPP